MSINISLPAPGRWGSSRNSRCLLLLLTSASTAAKLDHYDANLRRYCDPGEEPGSIRLIEREGASKSEARVGGGKWGVYEDSREGDRQRSLPGCNCEHSDDETVEFAFMPRWWELSLASLPIYRNVSPDTLLKEDTKALRNHEYFIVIPLKLGICLKLHVYWSKRQSILNLTPVSDRSLSYFYCQQNESIWHKLCSSVTNQN